MGNPKIDVDIINLVTAPSINPNDDYIMMHNFDTNVVPYKVKLYDAVLNAIPVVGASSLGSGTPVFKQLNTSRFWKLDPFVLLCQISLLLTTVTQLKLILTQH